jgi:hypothetical protein
MNTGDIDLYKIRDTIAEWRTAGALPPDVLYTLTQLADAVGQLRHDYNICHNDAVANAEYASYLERQLYK